MLKIRRSKPAANFTILPNELLRDDRLTYCARGVLAELLSRPSGWETNADALSERARRHRGDVVGEGRRGLRAAFAELEAAGYVIRRKEKAEKGRFVTVLEVYDVPQGRGTARGTSASVTSASVTSAAGTSSVSTDGRSTDEEDAGEEHSSALAGARAGQQAGPQDRRREELHRLYEAANELDDHRLRRLLLQFEKKRPRIYREQRQLALAQLARESPKILRTADSVRAVDLLSFKYALLHYQEPGIPEWLRRFPRPR
ncbi:hypothetical protein [Streptomyces bugieae]|uniref:Uncharacterized protein n=1 Tax=Streptomyces bugieae TaxID=3098223 RepID=A0ABU7NMW4_9ACTN|nr:hypothetical protein [Streptomyces sp. DSM 41528]